jgi:Uma2 family endonuclease
MSTAARFQTQYTVADYRRWEGRWELWDGMAVAMSPSAGGRHAKVHGRIVAALANAIDAAGSDATVLVEIDWIVSRDTVVRPDVTALCGPEPAGHVEQPPALVVEILSDATRDRDLIFKRDLYATQGVRWYMILDPDAGTILPLRLTGGLSYASLMDQSGPSYEIDLCDDCRIRLDAGHLFR